MNVKMQKIETNVVELEITVEAQKFGEALKKSYNKNARNFNVPGFRKGKVPMNMVKQYYGIGVLYEDAINFAIEETYPKALDESSVKPVDYPQIDIVEVEEGKDFIYKAKVVVVPEVELGEYKNVEVKKVAYEVSEEDVEKQLNAMSEKNARVEVKSEGSVEKGNIAVIDFKGFIDGVAFEGGEGKDYPLEIGSGTFIGDFEDQLVGVKVNEMKNISVSFPENYGKEDLNGKPATFEVTVKEIKVKELPALDDEFAQEVSEFDTLEELKNDIRSKISESNDLRAKREFEENLINTVVDNAKVEIPEVMVTKEVDAMLKDLESRLQYQGLDLQSYYEFTNNTEEKMRDYMKENAERKVKTDLVLDKIAKAENIEAEDEELKAKALELAKQYSDKEPEKMADLLLKAQEQVIKLDVVTEKTIKILVENANIIE
ncbi:trigger factor [Clostridium amylolyticum]|uniref:Trigger factor n=1 Tax=Clostridium amylolyticum TaxID=1121298 RepID=A0A1M6MRF2_9CLOT|nr:trigger factor [Clostridium amylolyticum]SHJ85986.1 trigger factor [Clostridium amylolyticum]